MKLTASQINQIKIFFSDKPAKKVYLFGSYARGEADENSDIDLLIDWDYSKIYGFDYIMWNQEIKELLKKKVDFVSVKWISPLIESYVDNDKILIYEA